MIRIMSALKGTAVCLILLSCIACQAAPIPSPTAALPPTPPASAPPTAIVLPTITPPPAPTPEPVWRPVRILDHGEDDSGRNWITCLGWSPDGTLLAAGDTSGSVLIWDVERIQRLQALPHPAWPESCDWSPSGDQLAVGSNDTLIRIWDASTGQRQRVLDGHLGTVYTLAWSPDGATLAALGSLEKSARTWDVETGEPLHALPSAEGTNDLDWSPDGTAIATSTGEGVKVWEAASGRLLYMLETAGGTQSVRWSPDGLKLLASGSVGPAAWQIIGARPVGLAQFEGRASSPALWSPDGSKIAVGYRDGSLKVWNAQTGASVFSGQAPWGLIVELAWSPDSNFLAGYVRHLGGEEFLNWILVWNLDETGEPAVLKAHEAAVFHLAWSPKGNILASGAHDGQVLLWALVP